MVPSSSGNWQVKIEKGQSQDFVGNVYSSKFGVQLTGLQFVKIIIFTKETDNIEATCKYPSTIRRVVACADRFDWSGSDENGEGYALTCSATTSNLLDRRAQGPHRWRL